MRSWTNATPPRREPGRAVLRPAKLAHRVLREAVPTDGPLSVWVRHVWSLAWEIPVPAASTVVIPHPTVHLTLESGPDGEVRHGHRMPAALLHGVPMRRFAPALPVPGWVVGLHLVPGAAFDLIGCPAHSWTGRVVSWPEVWPGWDFEGVDRAGGPRPRAEAMRALAAAVIGERRPSPDGQRARSVERLVRTDRTIGSVEDLAQRMAMPVRRLQRLSRDHLGVSPRWLLRRARVLDAHELLSTTDLDIAEIAHRLGWYDQAHLTRDYTAIAGIPPARLRRTLAADRSAERP